MYASNAGTSQAIIRSTANEERSMTETKKKRMQLEVGKIEETKGQMPRDG
ncbi:hypothetical protein ALC53_10735 [Atta colombica]|uniref:Uncharacterized protein n=1 Tax=Atta colombica TaxID=520822 RepID=A0A151I0B4_9HYME|nr:hypothetical protein ALC53_10735 [Atta colombica]